jgi:hypothetical protein
MERPTREELAAREVQIKQAVSRVLDGTFQSAYQASIAFDLDESTSSPVSPGVPPDVPTNVF